MASKSRGRERLVVLAGLIVGLCLSASGAPASKAAKTNSPAPLVVRMDPPPTINVEAPKSSSPPTWTYWLPAVLSGLTSGLLGFFGVFIALRYGFKNTEKTVSGTLEASRATNWQHANENELKAIQERLEKFYGPLMTRLQADHLIAQHIRERQPAGYRLLRNLFDPDWKTKLSEGDRKLIELICVDHAEKLEKMIVNAGSVDPLLIPYFSRAVTHFRILRLAYQEMLGPDFEPFRLFVYPRPLDRVLVLEIKRLTARVADLHAKPTEQLPPIPPLQIPDEPEYRLEPWPDPDGRILKSEKWLL